MSVYMMRIRRHFLLGHWLLFLQGHRAIQRVINCKARARCLGECRDPPRGVLAAPLLVAILLQRGTADKELGPSGRLVGN